MIRKSLRIIVFLLFVISLISFIFVYFLNHDVSYDGKNHSDPNIVSIPKNSRENIMKSGKILFMTASYTMNQYEFLRKVIKGYRDICEAGWDVDIAIQASNGLNAQSEYGQELQNSAYCHRIQRPLNISYQSYGQIGFGLNSKHRKIMKEKLRDYDYFVYSEEDMLFTPHHLKAYLQQEKKLQNLFPQTWMNYTVGYLRYEMLNAFTQVTWEYMPDKIQVIKLDNATVESYHQKFPDDFSSDTGYYVTTNNLNQAFYIFSQVQVQHLEESCEFLSKPGRNLFLQQLRKALNKDWKFLSVGVSEWSSSFQQILQCGLQRIVPLEDFQSFLLHHMTDLAHNRRLKRELLTQESWSSLIAKKRVSPLTLNQVYQEIVYYQYNLHLMNYTVLDKKIKFVQWKL